MKTIQLSIEELIFSFYSEGLYEQGISLKETYFPALQDSELKLMLEFASRSLLAKNMAKEVNRQYKLKEEYIPFIQILSSAEKTVKASKFNVGLEGEDSISFHFKNEEIYFHRLLHDHQVHCIAKLDEENEILSIINEFFNFNTLLKQSEVLFKMKNDEFEEFLNEVSQSDSMKESLISKWNNRLQGQNTNEFIEDISKRSGKMDSLLSMNYDSNNNPALIDLHFVIPGKEGFWYISRDENLDLNVQKANEAAIKNLFSKDQILSM